MSYALAAILSQALQGIFITNFADPRECWAFGITTALAGVIVVRSYYDQTQARIELQKESKKPEE